MLLWPDVCFEAHYGLRSGIARRPKSATLEHRQLLARLLVGRVRREIGEAKAARPRKAFVRRGDIGGAAGLERGPSRYWD